MKKITKKSLDELSQVMPVISELEQMSYVGGADYQRNTDIEAFMRALISGEATSVDIKDYLPVSSVGYNKSNFSIEIDGKRIQCRAIDFGNFGDHTTLSTGEYTDPRDIMDGKTLVGRTYKWTVNGGGQNLWFAVEAESIEDFESFFPR